MHSTNEWGATNQKKELVEIKNKGNKKETKKTIVVDMQEGSTQLDMV